MTNTHGVVNGVSANPCMAQTTWNTVQECLWHAGQASMQLHRDIFGVKQSAMCFGDMAEHTTKAYMELDKAAKSLSVTSNAMLHDTRPATKAAHKVEDAMHLIKPLTEMTPEDKLTDEGPLKVTMVESVQSNTRRPTAKGPPPASGSSVLPLFPAILLISQLQLARDHMKTVQSDGVMHSSLPNYSLHRVCRKWGASFL